MNRAQLEAKVLQRVDLIRRGIKVEENLVEVKGEWPSPSKFARQLAGLCNAARGQPGIAIFGIDEESGRLSPLKDEASIWYAKLCAKFEGLAPRQLDHITVPVDDFLLHVFVFETDRAPYVVHVLDKDERPTGQFEVLYRTATLTRSARREDLLRMLVPAIVGPELEILGCHVADRVGKSGAPVVVNLVLYCMPRTVGVVGMADHRLRIDLWTDTAKLQATEQSFKIAKTTPPHSGSDQEALIDAPCRLAITASLSGPGLTIQGMSKLRLIFRWYPAASDLPVVVETPLKFDGSRGWNAVPPAFV